MLPSYFAKYLKNVNLQSFQSHSYHLCFIQLFNYHEHFHQFSLYKDFHI
jgi:hypothetical protein